MLKILICGATGFIGRNLVNYFSSNPNYQIFAVHNNRKPFDVENAANKITWIKADLRKSDDVFKVVNSMDIIIQAAATTSGAKDIVSKKAISDDLKLLLRLFSKDEALKYLDAG